MRGPASCSLRAPNIIAMQDTDAARAESAVLQSGTLHSRSHTNTPTRSRPALLAVNHSPSAGTSDRPVSRVKGQRSPQHPHTLLFSFVCLSAGAASFPGVSQSLRPSFTPDFFFSASVTRFLAHLFFWLVTSEQVAARRVGASVEEPLCDPVSSVQTLQWNLNSFNISLSLKEFTENKQ